MTPAPTFAIRPAKPSDLEQIREIAQRAYSQYIQTIGRAPAPMVADFEAQIAQDMVHVAAEPNDQAIAYIVFFPKLDTLFLENIAVHPDHAGQGIGKALIAFCEAQAISKGRAAVTLYTNEKMTANLSLYPKLGYIQTGRKTENGFNRVYFCKNV